MHIRYILDTLGSHTGYLKDGYNAAYLEKDYMTANLQEICDTVNQLDGWYAAYIEDGYNTYYQEIYVSLFI